jgi:hypothetical protein
MKRSDLKKLFDIAESWTRIDDEQAVLGAYDHGNQAFWEIVANSDGDYRIRRRPDRYMDDERSYISGTVPSEPSQRATLSAAKKAARKALESWLMKVAEEEGRAPAVKRSSPIYSKRLDDPRAEAARLLAEADRLDDEGFRLRKESYKLTGAAAKTVFDEAEQARLAGNKVRAEAMQLRKEIRESRKVTPPAPSPAGGRYLYRPLYRPASFATVPKGWDYVEAPAQFAPNRTDIPRSMHKFGIIAYDHQLTDDEVSRYELDYVGSE